MPAYGADYNKEFSTRWIILSLTAPAGVYDDVKECFSAGMNEHISKPIDSALLCRTLQKFCC